MAVGRPDAPNPLSPFPVREGGTGRRRRRPRSPPRLGEGVGRPDAPNPLTPLAQRAPRREGGTGRRRAAASLPSPGRGGVGGEVHPPGIHAFRVAYLPL